MRPHQACRGEAGASASSQARHVGEGAEVRAVIAPSDQQAIEDVGEKVEAMNTARPRRCPQHRVMSALSSELVM
jgi:hypothetical protein